MKKQPILLAALALVACTKAQRAEMKRHNEAHEQCYAKAELDVPQMKAVRENQDNDSMLGFVVGGVVGGSMSKEGGGFSGPHAVAGMIIGNAMGSDDEIERQWDTSYEGCMRQHGYE